jgi:DNA primase
VRTIVNQKGNLERVLWYYNLLFETGVSQTKIVCPFHDDINPSMIVDFENQNWFCFGCNRSGDAYKFSKLMEEKSGEKLNDLQAYQVYMQILKSSKTSSIKITHALRKHKAPDQDLYNEAWDYYYGLGKTNWRDNNDEEIKRTRQYMFDRGFSTKTLSKCGAKINYSRSYGLIFPMLDNGEFKGWVCRTMIKSVEEKRKYLYNEGFSRATTLVGDYGSKDWVIVVEGYMDRLKFIQNGVDNVVAILGWKMADPQIKKLKSAGIKYVISALDNDDCGKKGTAYLQGIFKVTRFQYLKGTKDPGEMNPKQFSKMFRRTLEIFNIDRRKQNGSDRQN